MQLCLKLDHYSASQSQGPLGLQFFAYIKLRLSTVLKSHDQYSPL